MNLTIDGKPIRDLSVDQLGATLQQIASELSIRGNAAGVGESASRKLLWAFDEIEEAARILRKLPVEERFYSVAPNSEPMKCIACDERKAIDGGWCAECRREANGLNAEIHRGAHRDSVTGNNYGYSESDRVRGHE